jgi:hypothetical protein
VIADNPRVYMSTTAQNIALTTAYPGTGSAFGKDAAHALSQVLANQAHISLAHISLTTIVTAATVTWFLARDSSGAFPITPEQTDTIAGIVAASGAVNRTLGIDYAKVAVNGTDGVYLFAKLDAGTANATGFLHWKRYTREPLI